jgi:hypothetical protein
MWGDKNKKMCRNWYVSVFCSYFINTLENVHEISGICCSTANVELSARFYMAVFLLVYDIQ